MYNLNQQIFISAFLGFVFFIILIGESQAVPTLGFNPDSVSLTTETKPLSFWPFGRSESTSASSDSNGSASTQNTETFAVMMSNLMQRIGRQIGQVYQVVSKAVPAATKMINVWASPKSDKIESSSSNHQVAWMEGI